MAALLSSAHRSWNTIELSDLPESEYRPVPAARDPELQEQDARNRTVAARKRSAASLCGSGRRRATTAI